MPGIPLLAWDQARCSWAGHRNWRCWPRRSARPAVTRAGSCSSAVSPESARPAWLRKRRLARPRRGCRACGPGPVRMRAARRIGYFARWFMASPRSMSRVPNSGPPWLLPRPDCGAEGPARCAGGAAVPDVRIGTRVPGRRGGRRWPAHRARRPALGGSAVAAAAAAPGYRNRHGKAAPAGHLPRHGDRRAGRIPGIACGACPRGCCQQDQPDRPQPGRSRLPARCDHREPGHT